MPPSTSSTSSTGTPDGSRTATTRSAPRDARGGPRAGRRLQGERPPFGAADLALDRHAGRQRNRNVLTGRRGREGQDDRRDRGASGTEAHETRSPSLLKGARPGTRIR